MSTLNPAEALRQALESTGNGWLLGYWGRDADRFLDQTVQALGEFAAEYERRFGERPDPFHLLDDDPAKGRAFFQIDTFVVSLEMKLMIWRILLGCEILRVDFSYDLEGPTRLSVTLRSPYGDEEQYQGEPGDFRVLRHFGATGTADRLILQGYYPLK